MNKLLLLSLSAILLMGCKQKSTQANDSPANDSVQKYLTLAENDTLDYNKRVLYNDKALSFIDLKRNDSVTIKNLYKVSFKNFQLNRTQLLKKSAETLLKISKTKNDSIGMGYANRNIGLYYMLTSNNEKAIEYLFRAKSIFKSLKKEDYVDKITFDILLTQSYACDYLGSNKTAFEIIKKFKSKKHLNVRCFCYNIIANNLSGLKLHSKAIEYYLKAIMLDTKLHNKYNSFNNIAHEYIILGQYHQANNYLKKIILIKSNRNKYPREYAFAESLFALSKLESNRDTTSIELLKDADSIFLATNSPYGYNYNLIYLSKAYSIKKDSTKAINYAKKAVAVSESYKNPNDVLLALTQLIKVDKKNATENALKYIKVSDSLNIKERMFRDKFAQIQFETEEITQQKETALKQRTFLVLISLAVFLIAILIVIIARQRLKQKELRLQHTQQKANEEIYQLMLVQKAKEDAARQKEKKRIGLELHDGVMNKLTSTRLNLSVLSINKDKETVDKCLPYIHNIQAIENEIRNLTHNLNQKTALYEDGFEKLLTDLTAEQKQISPVDFQLKIDSAIVWEKIDDIQKMNLYRILQEACQNINKHAKAKNAEINFAVNDQKLHLTITDDGIGIQPNNPQKGIGLKNIKYRVKQIGGKFILNSKPNQGTSLTITIPLKN